MASLYPLSHKYKAIFFYDIVAFTLWVCCFLRFLILLPLVGRRYLPGGIADFFHVVSLLPFLGFVLTRSLLKPYSLKDNAFSLAHSVKMGWICYGVIFPYPKIARHTTYSCLIFSWCLQYMVNFGYRSFKTKTGTSPFLLFWLQYHIHYVTYITSFASELVMIFLSLMFIEDDSVYGYFLKAAFVLYVPLGYFSWEHFSSKNSRKYHAVIDKNRRSAEHASTSNSSARGSQSENIQLNDLRSRN